MRANFEQAARGVHAGAFDERRFGCILMRDDERALIAAGAVHHRQRAAYRAQFAGQCQLARKFVTFKTVGRELAGSGENAQGDRQIEPPALFRQVGRRQVDRDPPRRQRQP